MINRIKVSFWLLSILAKVNRNIRSRQGLILDLYFFIKFTSRGLATVKLYIEAFYPWIIIILRHVA